LIRRAAFLAAFWCLLPVNALCPDLQTATERVHKPAPATPEPPRQKKCPQHRKKPEDPLFKGMQYRLIGPFRGGRSLTASGIAAILQPIILALPAVACGSLPTAPSPGYRYRRPARFSIGSLAVAPSEPNTVYVGTGEACIRAISPTVTGVQDAGRRQDLEDIGLRDSRAIGRVIVHPANPNIALLPRLDTPLGPIRSGGVFRTTDAVSPGSASSTRMKTQAPLTLHSIRTIPTFCSLLSGKPVAPRGA